jgi:transcriptional regulator with XRE-family HTH domain/quercetin dioxygenase-like cupin family protein
VPVFSSHLPDYKRQGICHRIRQERVRKGLTLRQLAGRVAISEAKLSNIENGKVTLELSELAELAAALGVALTTFFPRSRIDHYLIKRSGDLSVEPPTLRQLVGPEPGPSNHHNRVWPLAELFVGKHMEPLFAEVMPLDEADMHFIAHDHEEFMFVLRGQVETRLKTNEGIITEELDAGDCLYFRSNLPHCHRSLSRQPAATIHVIYSLRGPIDPNDGELGSIGQRFYRRGIYSDAVHEATEKVRLLRRSHGSTLADVSRDTGAGVRRLAQIERGEKAPDVDLLLMLARKFRRPIEYFFSTTLESQPYYFIQRAAQIKEIATEPQRKSSDTNGTTPGRTCRLLASGFPDRGLHPYYVQVMAVGEQAETVQSHHGEEFIYVLEGEVEFITHTGDKEVTELLHPGDSLFLESSVPHLLRGHRRNPFAERTAETLAVYWSPLGEEYVSGK